MLIHKLFSVAKLLLPLELKLEMSVEELLSVGAFEKYFCAASTNQVGGKITKECFSVWHFYMVIISVGFGTGSVAISGKPHGYDRL